MEENALSAFRSLVWHQAALAERLWKARESSLFITQASDVARQLGLDLSPEQLESAMQSDQRRRAERHKCR